MRRTGAYILLAAAIAAPGHGVEDAMSSSFEKMTQDDAIKTILDAKSRYGELGKIMSELPPLPKVLDSAMKPIEMADKIKHQATAMKKELSKIDESACPSNNIVFYPYFKDFEFSAKAFHECVRPLHEQLMDYEMRFLTACGILEKHALRVKEFYAMNKFLVDVIGGIRSSSVTNAAVAEAEEKARARIRKVYEGSITHRWNLAVGQLLYRVSENLSQIARCHSDPARGHAWEAEARRGYLASLGSIYLDAPRRVAEQLWSDPDSQKNPATSDAAQSRAAK